MQIRTVICASMIAAIATVADAKPPKTTPGHPHAATAPVVHKIPETGVLNAADLVAIAKLEASNHSDQFSDDPTLAYVGREFTVTVDASDLTTNYDKDTDELKVSSPEYLDYLKLAEDKSVSHYTGQNGYGASAQVTRLRGHMFGIWLPGQSFSRKPLRYETKLDGPAARDLSSAIKLRISGVITRAGGVWAHKDSAIMEKSIISDATVSDPYDTFIQGYYVSVAFTKADWIDGRSNAVIASQDVGS